MKFVARRSNLMIIFASSALLAACLAGCSDDQKPPETKVLPKYSTLPPRTDLPPYMKDSIYEKTETQNTDPLLASNYTLIVNLDNTGDSTAPTSVRQYILNMMAKRGFGSAQMPGFEKLDPQEVLKDKRVAIVRVDALLPAGVRKGQVIDAQVSALESGGNTTSSLAHGRIYSCQLMRGGADPRAPGQEVNVEAAVGDSPVFVNPAYALNAPTTPQAKASLRYGIVMGHARVMMDRSIMLRVRVPQASLTRVIEARINRRFQDVGVAKAFDEGIVQLFVPESYHGDWEHFLGVATHLYLPYSAAFNVEMAKRLAAAAQEPNARLMDISYAWEGLESDALPIITPLMNSSSPDISYAAARAAAFIGDPSAIQILQQIAQTPHHPFQINAVQTLGSLTHSPLVLQTLRSLLDSDENGVRIEAYKVLAEATDSGVYSRMIPGNDPQTSKFILDIVPSSGKPLIYATRRGTPRIVIFGSKPALDLPLVFTAFDKTFSISTAPDQRNVTLFYRGGIDKPITLPSRPDVAELVARLGGEGAKDEPMLDFSYGEIVAILQSLADEKDISALASATSRLPMKTPFVLEDLPVMQNSLDNAPVIPDQVRPEANSNSAPSLDALNPPQVQTTRQQ